ncbi:hypothetical protein RCO27_07310 [Sphingosinicella sp. LHD-64]|uniref:hypothetical protein n=1 Tax=Sphingosinicella sp. LHD-64 TaxID=3072139 RepID=UPI00280D3088|nr:hypothetical protein [Sphingosinicella sp. LHD-64]MDQ8756035.1 hypothetical protein [Sphingosinicella sp. LHD-64]
MMKAVTLAAALIGAAPLLAAEPAPGQTEETRIPRMRSFLEAVVRDDRGVYVRADTGQWYYARTRGTCARLRPTAPLAFETTPQGDLDRFGAIRVEGWRCPLESVTQSAPPPPTS